MEWKKALREVDDLLQKAKIHYAFGGSVLLCMAGVLDQPHDIDLFFDSNEWPELKRLMADRPHQIATGDHPFYATRFFLETTIADVDVDMMGDFGVVWQNEKYYYPFNKDSEIRWRDVEGRKYPFMLLEDWYLLYGMMPSKIGRLLTLEKYLENHPDAWDKSVLKAKLDIPLPEETKRRAMTMVEHH